MTLVELVPTLETCRRLNESGFPQDTYAAYILYDDGLITHMLIPRGSFDERYVNTVVAAPTAAEIGKWLPKPVPSCCWTSLIVAS